MPQTNMRVLQTGNDWFAERPGGLNRFYGELLKALPAAGVQVHGLVVGSAQISGETGGTVEGFSPANTSLPLRLLKARSAIQQQLKVFRPDVVASHFALYAAPALDVIQRRPFVVHFHGPWAAEAGVEGKSSLAGRAQASLERAVYSKARKIIVLSQAFRSELIRRYAVSPERVVVIPGGIDADRFNDRLSRQEARERLAWPTDRPIVVSVRRQMRRMGLENLIDAVADLRKSIPDVLVMLAGSGPLMDEFRERIAAKDLTQHIRQLGRVDDADLPLIYRAADLSIVPTQALEGFGMITLESLASGTPVLVTPVGGLPEVLQPFAPDCILPDASSATIRDVLLAFLKGSAKLPSDQACREYAEGNFAWPVIAAKTRRVYEDARS